VDVLDPAVMPAVDAPSTGGIAYAELELLIAGLVASPACLGMELTVFDPDYDPDGVYARDIADTLVAGLSPVVHDEPVDLGVAAPHTGTVMPAQRTAPAEVEAG
jgi:arginase